MAACDGSVSGTTLRALVNFVPRDASPSIAGVSPRPTRSARNVSTVMRRTFGFCRGAGAGALLQAVSSNSRRPPHHFTVQLCRKLVGRSLTVLREDGLSGE